MGDFDRNAAPKQNDQSKKIIFVIILGVVFICVLGYPMMKGGPKSAAASSGAGDAFFASSDAASTDTPEQVRDALHIDPTAGLLAGPAGDLKQFNIIPHNPFVMSEAWRSSLIRPDPVHPTIVRHFDPTPAAPHVALTVKIDAYKLNSIVRLQDRLQAIINGNIVSAGMVVDGARILEIRADRVILQNADDPEGPSVEITLVPTLK